MRRRETAGMQPNVQTRMCIVDAAAKLAKGEDLDALTVNDICAESGVSRATFYYHFRDKYDIIQWHYDYVAERNLFETGRTLTWFQAHYRNTYEVLEKEDLYRCAFRSRGYQSLFSYSKRRRIETLKQTLVEYKHVELDTELGFQIYALAESEVASMGKWFKDDMPFDLETLCRYLDGIVPPRLHDLLDKPVNPRLF